MNSRAQILLTDFIVLFSVVAGLKAIVFFCWKFMEKSAELIINEFAVIGLFL